MTDKRQSPIPTLTKDELLSRAFRITPVVENDQGQPHFITPCDIENTAFTWSPKREDEAAGLTPLKTITTYHDYGAPVFFKPSINEVLAQIPPELLGKVTGFSTEPDQARQFTPGGSHHVGITTLYTGDLPASVRDAPVVYKGKKVYPSKQAEAKATGIPVMKPIQFKRGPKP